MYFNKTTNFNLSTVSTAPDEATPFDLGVSIRTLTETLMLDLHSKHLERIPFDESEPFSMSTFSLARCHGLMASQKVRSRSLGN